jgi:hypothetical protein
LLAYHKVLCDLEGIQLAPPPDAATKEAYSKSIVKAELAIVKTMFSQKGTIIGSDLPYRYAHEYLRVLFTSEEYALLLPIVITYVNDVFFTSVPLVYGSKEIGLACVLICARQMKVEISAVSEEKWERMIENH